ncbi:hypothetical protein EC968_000933 [Mortierella alpina]|nr:hypothetical protein EC968_000933 [Mortierella alpina]
MSFFKKDYSAYPQPVVVTPDPALVGESISDAVAEPIAPNLTHRTQATASNSRTHATEPATERTETSPSVDPRPKHNTRDGSASEPATTHSIHIQHQQQQLPPKDSTRLADGIMSLLGPIVQEMDFNIVSVRKSQTELEKEIERLMAELQLFMASSAAPPEVEPAVQKLVKARRQIMTANSTLKAVQERVDRMHQQIERRQ